MSGLRNISGGPRCVDSPLDCEDFASEFLYNDIADRTIFELAAGSMLATGKGTRINGLTRNYFQEDSTSGMPSIKSSFELMHGQDRFRLLTSGIMGVQFSGGWSFPTVFTTNISFKVRNISQGTEANICQIFLNKTAYDSAVASYGGPTQFVTPAAVAPYIVDLGLTPPTNTTDFNLSFEQQWPSNIYPLAGQSDLCELLVIFNALDPFIPYGTMRVDYFDLRQILEPTP